MMGKKERFDYFTAFERQAEFACKEAEMLKTFICDFDPSTTPEYGTAMHNIEHEADLVNHEIFAQIATEFIAPLEREDIVGLAQNLDDVVDCTEDVMQRFYMFNVQTMHPAALEYAEIIENAAIALREAMGDFRNFKKSKILEPLIVKVSDYEEDADRLYLDSTRGLYINNLDDPVYILTWNNIFNRMEHCCDACEHVADIMQTIIMKNS